MINFELGLFWQGLETLNGDISYHRLIAIEKKCGGYPEEHSRLQQNIQLVSRECVGRLRLLLPAKGPCVRLEDMLAQYHYRRYTHKEIVDELQHLVNEIREEARLECFSIINAIWRAAYPVVPG
jgi:hypothetical protein